MNDDYTTIKKLLTQLHETLDKSQEQIDSLRDDIQHGKEAEESARQRSAQMKNEYEQKGRKH